MTKVLVCIPHFYNRTRPYDSDVMGSSVDPVEKRIEVVRYCLRRMQSLLSDDTFVLRTSPASQVGFDTMEAVANSITGDVCLCFSGDDHFFSEVASGNVVKGMMTRRDPRLLGYACRRMFAENVDHYDLYCFIEDDCAVLDGEFFTKIAGFYRVFGEDRVILPNRFELAGIGEFAWKAYIDEGAFSHMQIDSPAQADATLRLESWPRDIQFELTRSPFCGCYIITNAQLRRWMSERDFVEPDPSLAGRMDLMELAGIPMMGRLPIYKPSKSNAGFLEIHHVPDRVWNGDTPQNVLKELVKREVDRRSASSLSRRGDAKSA